MSKREQNQRHYQRHKAKIDARNQGWREANPKQFAFLMQRQHAKERGIDFEFDFDEWVEWWGDDFDRRGCEVGQLVMARYNDEGAYEPDNVVKVTCSENSGDSNRSLGKKIAKPA